MGQQFAARAIIQELYDFAALDRQVREARMRRTGWKVASFVGILGGFVVLGPPLSATLVELMTSGLR